MDAEKMVVFHSNHSFLSILHFRWYLNTRPIHQGWPIFDFQRIILPLASSTLATPAISILVFGMWKWQNKLSFGLQTGMILSMIPLEFSPSTRLETSSSVTVITVLFGLQMFLSKGQPPLLLCFKIQGTWYWSRAITKRCYGKALTTLQTLCFHTWGWGWIG